MKLFNRFSFLCVSLLLAAAGLAAYLREHPKARLGEAVAASTQQRQEVYQWLFRTRHKGAQDARKARSSGSSAEFSIAPASL